MKISWPRPTATSAVARDMTSSIAIVSTWTLVLCCLPHSTAYSLSNHWLYSGRKCAQCAIFSVPCWARERSGSRKNGPTAAAVEPASLRNSRRECGFLLPIIKPHPSPGTTPGEGCNGATEGFPLFTVTPLFVAEFPIELQTGEVSIERRIQRRSIRLVDLIEKCVRSDCAVTRVEYGRANQPHCASVSPSSIFLSFRRAGRTWRVLAREARNWIYVLRGTLQEVQLLASLNNGASVQADPVLLSERGEHLMALAGLARTKAGLNVPEVRDD